MATPRRATPSRSGAASRSRASRADQGPPSLWQRHRRDLWIVALGVLAMFVLLAQFGALGPFGRSFATGLEYVFGIARIIVPVLLLLLGAAMLSGRVEVERARFGWGIALALISVSGLGDVLAGRPSFSAPVSKLADAGGWLGVITGGTLAKVVGSSGALVVLLALAVISVMIGGAIGLRTLVSVTIRCLKFAGRHFFRWWAARPTTAPVTGREVDDDLDDLDDDAIADAEVVAPRPRRRRALAEHSGEDDDSLDRRDDDQFGDVDDDVPAAPVAAYVGPTSSSWTLPPLGLLSRPRVTSQDRDAIEGAGVELVDALAAHGVDTTLVGFTVGPTVTRYELELGPGVKVARVTSLHRDIAYAMASPDVRILAPIPGRSAIGVEVPNRQRVLVSLGDLLHSEEALAANHPLDVPIGRDISGKTVVVNLGAMPHVLISGATGAGKSSCINSLLTSLVMRATPDQVKLILVDPKRVELGQYNDLPHLLAPVVVDPKKAAGALAWAVKEMERRYDILAESGSRDITSYQQQIARGEIALAPTSAQLVGDVLNEVTSLQDSVGPREPENLPYIVIVVDELNDLMMVAARDVEESVVRIAQMARAVGIHLVLATQRPSVDVITGVIKANVPSRMAFAVSSLADSRVILDQAGAERLIGKGDMLLVTASSNIAQRLQSPWVSEEEVRTVVDYWRAQGGQRETVVALETPSSRGGSFGGSGSDDDDDEILRQARELVIRTQSGSTSMLQRKLRIGFARAGRIMDELENEGVVGPGDGSKSRKVLISPDDVDEDF